MILLSLQFIEPLLKLRQDCSLPSIIIKTNSVTAKHNISSHDLLKHMTTLAENEAKSELRTIASSLNGLAALHIIKDNTTEAVKLYQQLLKWSDDYKGNVR